MIFSVEWGLGFHGSYNYGEGEHFRYVLRSVFKEIEEIFQLQYLYNRYLIQLVTIVIQVSQSEF